LAYKFIKMKRIILFFLICYVIGVIADTDTKPPEVKYKFPPLSCYKCYEDEFIKINNDTKYLCIAEHVAGHKYDNNSREWVSTTFKAGQKYIVKVNKTYSKWAVYDFGIDSSIVNCISDFSESGSLVCNSVNPSHFSSMDSSIHFFMNKNTLRFQLIYELGYINSNKNVDDNQNPYISIGTCTQI